MQSINKVRRRAVDPNPGNHGVSGNLIAFSRIPNANGKNRRQLGTTGSTMSLPERNLNRLPA